MNLAEARAKYLNKQFIINWSKLPGFDRKGATIPSNWENVVIQEVYETYDGRIMFLSDKTFTPFSIDLLEE